MADHSRETSRPTPDQRLPKAAGVVYSRRPIASSASCPSLVRAVIARSVFRRRKRVRRAIDRQIARHRVMRAIGARLAILAVGRGTTSSSENTREWPKSPRWSRSRPKAGHPGPTWDRTSALRRCRARTDSAQGLSRSRSSATHRIRSRSISDPEHGTRSGSQHRRAESRTRTDPRFSPGLISAMFSARPRRWSR